jgi:hypothetical protein
MDTATSFLPVPPHRTTNFPPDMIVQHDFGDGQGLRPAISERDFLVACGVKPEVMRKIDLDREAVGLPPVFRDETLELKPLG